MDSLLQSAVSELDAEALISISSETLVKIISAIPPTQRSLVSESTGARIPVVPNLEAVTPDLCHYSRACIVLEERVVLVWSQDPKAIVHVADHVQEELFEMVRILSTLVCLRPGLSRFEQTQTSSEEDFDRPDRARSTFTQLSFDTAPVASPTIVRGALDEKNEIFSRAVALEENEDENEDVEMAAPQRPRLKMHAFKISVAIMLVIITQSLGVIKVCHTIPSHWLIQLIVNSF